MKIAKRVVFKVKIYHTYYLCSFLKTTCLQIKFINVHINIKFTFELIQNIIRGMLQPKNNIYSKYL